MTNNDLKELTNFLDNYGVYYKVVENSVVADTVNLDDRGITQLPESIGHLKSRCLFLSRNNITSLPESFGNMKCNCLWLDGNNITSLHVNIGNLQCEYLNLSRNNITQLPDSFGNLKCEDLYLSGNELTTESIELLEKLKSAGVNVIYQPTKQTNIGGNIMTNGVNMVDPDHYKHDSSQTIDFIEDFLANESRLLTSKQKYSIGNAIKYLSRAGLKGSTPEDAIIDLKKAENYIHRAITGEWIDAS
jgi:hypothetical protein